MLADNLKAQLAAYLENLRRPIELIASLDHSEASLEMRNLLNDIVAASPKVSLREDGHATRRPSFGIAEQDQAARVEFAGLPMGHEFTSLVLALLHVGGHPPKISDELRAQIEGLDGTYQFETYVSLTCHNCPDVVQAFNTMSALNPNIRHVMIDGALFPDDVESRKVMAVPMVFNNDVLYGHGRMTLEEIVAKLDQHSAAKDAAKLSAKPMYDVLVIGGGPAGAAAAVYAARKGIRTGVVAERFGGQVADTMGIENYISVSETTGPKLVAAMEQHVKDYSVDVMTSQMVESISRDDSQVTLTLSNGGTLKSKTVVLATGARWRKMNVAGEIEYTGRGVAYCPHCDGPLFKGKRVAVIGGGNSGVEAAIDLAGIVQHVTLIEFDGKLRADAVLQTKLNSLPNVTIITQALSTEVLGDGNKVTGLVYQDRQTELSHTLALDGIFVQIGLLPNTDFLKGAIDLSARGEIEVNAKGETSMAGVFAAGDATTTPYKQIIIATGEGAKAALSAFDYLIRQAV
jgi:alkyl hydroperoxide reductase subunit F